MLELFYYDLLTIVLKTSINMTYKFSNNRKIFLLGLGRKFKAIKLVISNKVYSYNNPFIFPALAFFYFVPESIWLFSTLCLKASFFLSLGLEENSRSLD